MDLKQTKITWLGHATFLLTSPEGKTILVDPWLAGNPRCPAAYHDVASDAILVTHGHADHIGDLFSAQRRCPGPVVGIFDLTTWLGAKGIAGDRLVGMNKGGTVPFPDLKIEVTMTDARHSSSFTDENGTIVYLGEAAGYVVRFSSDLRIYVAGDTSLFGDMQWIRELYRPDLAILPIGDHFTMDPRAAAYACQLLAPQAVIPCHYGTFPLLRGTVAELRQHLAQRNLATEVIALEPGASVG